MQPSVSSISNCRGQPLIRLGNVDSSCNRTDIVEFQLTCVEGRKVILLSTIALLLISDLLCGLSTASMMLYICRGFPGVANGGITSLTMMIVLDVVFLKERERKTLRYSWRLR